MSFCRSLTTVAFAAGVTLAAQPAAARAQHDGGGATPKHVAPREASQFDFLVGQWDVVAKPLVTGLARIHGTPKILGTWKGWKSLDGWGVTDELRLVDASGNPRTFGAAVRLYDAANKRWMVQAFEVYRAIASSATGEWKDGTMVLAGRGTDADGKPTMIRTTFSKITATSFTMQQDRSTDDGRTWTEATLTIEAKKVAAVAPR